MSDGERTGEGPSAIARARLPGGIELAYETFGRSGDPPLLLVTGLGRPALSWADGFCRSLAGQGRFVVRFDNRDAGLSTRCSGTPRVGRALVAALSRRPHPASYTLDDMASDALALLDVLELGRVDLIGASMGGMIAQLLAIRAPERVRSLTSIRSTTGDRSLPLPRASLLWRLPWRASDVEDQALRQYLQTYRAVGSRGQDVEALRARARREVGRGWHALGRRRQLVAVLGSPDRTQALRGLRVPALVVHGDDDPLLSLAHGEATAAALQDCRLLVLPGVAHDLPEHCWSAVLEAVAALSPAPPRGLAQR